MNHKILITIDNFADKAKDVLKDMSVCDCLNLSQEELIEKISDYDILLVGLGLNVDKQVIDRAENLKIIATATTGLDHIDVEYAKEKGIKVISLKDEIDFLNSITGTAELAFGLMLDLLRNISASTMDVEAGNWDREKFVGYNLLGKTLGVVGFGRLGKMMAKYGKAFGMDIVVSDLYVDEAIITDLGYRKMSLEELLEKSDVVSIHVHLNPETENMFSLAEFEKMKNSAYLINTARGKIVNEKDLLKALANKEIAGYGTDVLAGETAFSEDKTGENDLIKYARDNSNLIITPHIGGMTYESREATDVFIAQKIINYL